MFPILETERLLLREIIKEDTEQIFRCFSDEKVTRFYGQEPLQSMEEAERLVAFFSKSYQEKRGVRWGIELKGIQGLIGTIGYNAWIPKHKRAEIGYEIHSDYWRKGYVSEAISSVLAYGFDVMSLNRIGAVVYIDNEASNNLLTKFGFEKEGVLKQYMFQNGVAHDTYVYSLLKERD